MGLGCVHVLTDYGYADEFAGVLRAAVVRRAPGAPVIDLTHGIEPFNVVAGSRALARCVGHLGPGVVVGVVDPGVGTRRRAVAIEVASPPEPGAGPRTNRDTPWALVGPDNGLLMEAADVLGGVRRVAELSPGDPPGTFDGRDVFAPAAARLWCGDDLGAVGTLVSPDGLVRLPDPLVTVGPGRVDCEVRWIDRFGNVQLAARPADLDRAGLGVELAVHAGGRLHRVRRVGAFAELTPAVLTPTVPADSAELGLLVDANGYVALVRDRLPASEVLGAVCGDVVVVTTADHRGLALGAGEVAPVVSETST